MVVWVVWQYGLAWHNLKSVVWWRPNTISHLGRKEGNPANISSFYDHDCWGSTMMILSFHSWKLSRSYDANIPLSAIIVTQQRVSSLCVELQSEQIISQISTQIIIWGPRVTNFDNGPINICIAGYNQKLICLYKNNCISKGLDKQKWRVCFYHSLKNLFLPLVKKSVFTTR